MKILFLTALFTFCTILSNAQNKSYEDSMQAYFSEYVSKHEVVTGNDKKLMAFYPANEKYRVIAQFEPVKKAKWFNINTSSGRTKPYRQFGKIAFTIDGKKQVLYLYQSQSLLQSAENWDHLFLPFMDATNGKETYETGRYIDLKLGDIKNNIVIIDFNKAYNPYCAYVSGKYSCPVPPKENHLDIEMKAGEKKFY